MKNKIKQTIIAFDMISKGDTVICALSGGADSVCLLHNLKEISDELGFRLCACHINHNLRGNESDADEKYVRSLCERLEIELFVYSVDVTGTLAKHQSVEERARELRYEVFEELSRKLGAKIATAHNLGDTAETVILNMIRGTGLKGLCGIPPVRDYLIRPLLSCERKEIEAYCKENSLEYVTDKTNFSTDYSRNKVRLELIPKLVEMNPSFLGGISRMTQNLIEDSSYLEAIAAKEKKNAAYEDAYRCDSLTSLDDCILHRVISLILWENKVEPTSLRIKGISQIIAQGKGKINIEKNKFAVVKKGLFKIETIFQNYRTNNT